MKKLMSLSAGLHVMSQRYRRQHFGACYWFPEQPGSTCFVERTHDEDIGKRINYLLCTRTSVQVEHSQDAVRSKRIRAQNNRFLHIKIALESCLEEHAKEVWERNWINPEMQTTLLDTYPPNLITTILKALREQLKENDHLNAVEEIAGQVSEIPLEYEQILKGGGFWDDVDGGYLPEDLVLAARREEIDWVRPEGVHEIVPMQECRDAGNETVGPDLVGHRQVCGSDKQENSIQVMCKSTRRRSKVRFNKLCQFLNCSLQCHLSKRGEGACPQS